MPKLKTLRGTIILCLLTFSLFLFEACDNEDEPKDTTPPEVSFANITPDMTVWNTVDISLDANDDLGIETIEVYADEDLVAILTASPYETSWDSYLAEDGAHTIKAIVTDVNGNTAEEEISVNVLNTLVTLSMADDQLYDEPDFSERGFIFLSDEEGNLISSMEYQNGSDITLKSNAFNGDKFFLTEALLSHEDGEPDELHLWTFTQIERGKNWVVIDNREEDETYAGEAHLSFTNIAADVTYHAASNGEQTSAYTSKPASTISLRSNNSKLYVTRDPDDESYEPVAYNLYSNIIIGANTINLTSVNKPLTKVTLTVPEGSIYSTTSITAYPLANTYTESYDIGYFSSGTDVLVYDIFYPETAFPTYYTETDYETGDVYYRRGSNSQTFTLPPLTNDVDLSFATGKLTYSASGDIDFLSTQYENDIETSYWSFILPKGTSQTIPALALPVELSSFDVPEFGFPPHYTVYDFDEITDYETLKTFIRSSTRSVDALYDEGKNFVDIVYKNPVPGGRVKSSKFLKAFDRKIRK
jgi:hypothetical protein